MTFEVLVWYLVLFGGGDGPFLTLILRRFFRRSSINFRPSLNGVGTGIQCTAWLQQTMMTTTLTLTQVDELHQHLQLPVSEVLQVDKRVLMGIIQQDVFEEWTVIAEDHFMGSYLLIIHSGQSNISKVFIFTQLFNSVESIGFKII